MTEEAKSPDETNGSESLAADGSAICWERIYFQYHLYIIDFRFRKLLVAIVDDLGEWIIFDKKGTEIERGKEETTDLAKNKSILSLKKIR